jgi:hypothetical protein
VRLNLNLNLVSGQFLRFPVVEAGKIVRGHPLTTAKKISILFSYPNFMIMPPLSHLIKPAFLFCFSIVVINSGYAQTSDSYNNLAKEAYDKKDYNLCIDYCTKSISISANGWAYWERGAAYYSL